MDEACDLHGMGAEQLRSAWYKRTPAGKLASIVGDDDRRGVSLGGRCSPAVPTGTR